MGESRTSEAPFRPGGRVLLLGLDGATFALLDQWMARGLMPNLQRLAAAGTRATLRSVFPPTTGPAWASFSTGVQPGKHGIFEFRRRVSGQAGRQIASRLDIAVPTVWDMLSEAGLQVGLVNLPVTYPPSDRTSFHLTDMLTPSAAANFAHPPGLCEQLSPELGEYVVEVSSSKVRDAQGMMRYLDDLSHCTRQRAKYAAHLMRTRPWDVATVVFVGTDRLQHLLWDVLSGEFVTFKPTRQMLAVKERAEQYLTLLDQAVGEVLAAAQEADVLVVSDHGFGPLRQKLRMNQWLAKQGLLTPSRRRRRLRRLVGAMDVLQLRRLVGRMRAHFHDAARKPEQWQHPFWRMVNWSATRAYAPSANEMGVCVNLRGREAYGIVSEGDEYERVRDEILACLRQLRDPETSEPLVTMAARREEVLAGDHLESAPDVLFILQDGACVLDVRLEGPLFEKASWSTWTGMHRYEGILIANGPRLRPRERLGEVGIVDIAPTVLRLCGLQAPEHMDGRALTELLTDAVPEPTRLVAASGPAPAEGAGVYSEDETREVEARLRDLGYL